MLDDFKEIQPIAYKTLFNTISKNRLSHAYLIETNNYYQSNDLVLAFAKYLLCPNHHHKDISCDTCHQIASGNYSEIKIIEADGLWIKKDQMIELQSIFSKKAIQGSNKLYIIKDADKLNQSSANSILKFLEEPEEGIIAILTTINAQLVMETIQSRCQIISLIGEDNQYKNKYSDFDNEKKALANYFSSTEVEFASLLNDIKFTELVENAILFVNKLEQDKRNMHKFINDHFKDINKEDLLIIFDLITLFYKDVLNRIINKDVDMFTSKEQIINEIALKNDTISISEKIKNLIEYKNRIKHNANTSLLMDKLIADGGFND